VELPGVRVRTPSPRRQLTRRRRSNQQTEKHRKWEITEQPEPVQTNEDDAG
jgi:hypothetical protein